MHEEVEKHVCKEVENYKVDDKGVWLNNGSSWYFFSYQRIINNWIQQRKNQHYHLL